MRKNRSIVFPFVVKYLSFLKHIPLAAWVFDAFLKIYTQLTKPQIIQVIDEVEEELENWQGISTKLHIYGGVQFNYFDKELGHIHSNGLADILLNTKTKSELIDKGLAEEHHIFKKAGWVSFYINSLEDKPNVINLFRAAYNLQIAKKLR